MLWLWKKKPKPIEGKLLRANPAPIQKAINASRAADSSALPFVVAIAIIIANAEKS